MPPSPETRQLTSLTNELTLRAARAAVSQLGPASEPLRRHLQDVLARKAGEPGSFLAEPIVEATFGWQEDPRTMDDLSGSLLHEDVVSALDGAGEVRFPKDAHPYVHQVKAWTALGGPEPRSVIVSTGTGSGKTECFLVPILNDLARESGGKQQLSGVRALFLYPLNALINSQRDRLRGWCRWFGGRVRFCLYNGYTPEHPPPADEARKHPEEALDRQTLRADPPPILVTNATMLEYMLMRNDDAPILTSSHGRLRWIVLDEAHTYVGSQAAEISLLLRRVLHAFGCHAKDVRFVATSATIGDGERSREDLRRYLADLAGIEPGRVEVVTGERSLPDLPPEMEARQDEIASIEEVESIRHPRERFERLASAPRVREVRATLRNGARPLHEVAALFRGTAPPEARGDGNALAEATRLLDVCASAALRSAAQETDPSADPGLFLPLRLHLFHRTIGHLWACSSPSCSGRSGTLAGESWKFGKIHQERREKCDAPGCGARVFEMVICRGCGAEYLHVQRERAHGAWFLSPARAAEDDEDSDPTVEEDEDLDDEKSQARVNRLNGPCLLGHWPPPEHADEDGEFLRAFRYDPATGEVDPDEGGVEGILSVAEPGGEGLRCARCGERERAPDDLFRTVRLGAPFFLSTAVPTVLETVPPMKSDVRLPFQGRRLITFSDSRQGTARFAARGQLDSELSYARSHLYHLLWSRVKVPSPEELKAQRDSVAGLEQALKYQPNPVLDKLLAQEREKLSRLEAESRTPSGSVSWKEAVESFLHDDPVRSWMRRHLQDRYQPADMSEQELAELLVYRELVRRPRRQNSLETMGLAALHYPFLDNLSEASLPPEWRRRGQSVESWRAFLKLAMDFFIRANTAVDVDKKYLRWMGTLIHRRVIAPPGEEQGGDRYIVSWPTVGKAGRLPRLASLLLQALKLDQEDEAARSDVNALLEAAWRALAPHLSQAKHGGASISGRPTSPRCPPRGSARSRAVCSTPPCSASPPTRRGAGRPDPGGAWRWRCLASRSRSSRTSLADR
jgi:DEAD/DEAH box helicase domain-containing protein